MGTVSDSKQGFYTGGWNDGDSMLADRTDEVGAAAGAAYGDDWPAVADALRRGCRKRLISGRSNAPEQLRASRAIFCRARASRCGALAADAPRAPPR